MVPATAIAGVILTACSATFPAREGLACLPM
jgi:hypothetical protein